MNQYHCKPYAGYINLWVECTTMLVQTVTECTQTTLVDCFRNVKDARCKKVQDTLISQKLSTQSEVLSLQNQVRVPTV